VAFLLMMAGGSISILLLNPAVKFLLDAVVPGFTATDTWAAIDHYMSFLGIWILTLIYFAVTSANRPLMKALTTKTRGNNLKMFALGLGIGLGMNLLCAFIAMANGDIRLTFSSFRPISFLVIFAAVFVQSSAEELLCRVFVYHRLMRRYGKSVLAVLVNSAFFALNHIFNDGISVLAMLNIFLYGLLFSAMVVYMDSPWATMTAHTAWNFCQNILLGLPNSGNVLPYSVFKLETATATDSFAYSVAFGLEGTITACVTLFAVAALIVWWGTKHKVAPTPVWEAEA
jgi:membrane protease YdiL (CAAX protease family)